MIPESFPRCLCLSNDEIVDEPIPIFHKRAVNPAKVLLCGESEYTIDKSAIILGNASLLASLTWQQWLQNRPSLVTYVMSMLCIFPFGTFFRMLALLYHISCVDTI